MTKPHDKSEHSKESEAHSGSSAFGFFHKHQKLIIYTAGIFTLLTFSITGALTGVMDRVTGGAFRGATIEVPGFGEVMITQADIEAAKGISQVRSNFYAPVIFPIMSFGDDGGSSQYIDQLAALYALAGRAGIEGSDDDVETIIQASILTHPDLKSAQQMAEASRTRDVALFRKWMRQTLRVSTLLRLSSLGVAQTQDSTVEQILEGNEQISFEVAYVDAKGFKDELKKKLDDATLKKFLEGLDESKSVKYRKPANRAAINVALLESGVFDHKEYLDKEIPKGTKVEDKEVQDYYLRHREDRWKLPKKEKPKETDPEKKGEGSDDKPKETDPKKVPDPKKKDDPNKDGPNKDDDDCGGPSLDEQDATKQGEATKKADASKQADATKQGDAEKPGDPTKMPGDQTEEVPGLIGAGAAQDPEYKKNDDALQAKIREQIYAEMVLAAWQGELDKAMAQHMEKVINSATATEIAVEDADEAKREADIELEKKPDDEALKTKVADAEKKVKAAEAAAKSAKEAVDAQRKAFDFEGKLKKIAGTRKGLKFIPVKEMKDAEGLREIDGVGKWRDSHLPGQMNLAGEVYNGPVQSTDKGAFIFHVTDIEERPFKEFKDIKEDLETDYLTTKAEADTKTKKEALEKALERLAREKLKDEIAKLEEEGKTAIAKEFDKWKTDLETVIADDDELLATLDKTLRSYKGRLALREGHQAELDKADEKKKAITEKIDKKTKENIEEKLTEVHKDVLKAAGAEAKMVVEQIGPYSRSLQSRPRFEHSHKNVVKALFGDPEISKFDVGDTTSVKDDGLNEVTFIAVCRKVEDGKITQISRREWLSVRDGGRSGTSFAGAQMEKALDQSYTLDALKTGYGWTEPKAKSVKDPDPSLGTPKAGTEGGKGGTDEKDGAGDKGAKKDDDGKGGKKG